MTSFTFFLIFIPILALILLGINFIFAPYKPDAEKRTTFECGFHSFLGQNRSQFSISFFIFALLFLLFDLEILLIYPYALSSDWNDIFGLLTMILFFILLTIGFVFELGKKALVIYSRQNKLSIKLSELPWFAVLIMLLSEGNRFFTDLVCIYFYIKNIFLQNLFLIHQYIEPWWDKICSPDNVSYWFNIIFNIIYNIYSYIIMLPELFVFFVYDICCFIDFKLVILCLIMYLLRYNYYIRFCHRWFEIKNVLWFLIFKTFDKFILGRVFFLSIAFQLIWTSCVYLPHDIYINIINMPWDIYNIIIYIIHIPWNLYSEYINIILWHCSWEYWFCNLHSYLTYSNVYLDFNINIDFYLDSYLNPFCVTRFDPGSDSVNPPGVPGGIGDGVGNTDDTGGTTGTGGTDGTGGTGGTGGLPGNNGESDSDSLDSGLGVERCPCGHEIGDPCYACNHIDSLEPGPNNTDTCCVCGSGNVDCLCDSCDCTFHNQCMIALENEQARGSSPEAGPSGTQPSSTQESRNEDVSSISRKRGASDGFSDQENKRSKN